MHIIKKALSILLLILICVGLLIIFGCKSGDNTDGEGTTVTEETTSAIPKVPVQLKQKITAEELGIIPYRISISDPSVAEAETLGTNMMVYTKTSGYVTFLLDDGFGHTASVDMTITETGEISYVAHSTTSEFKEVKLHYGAKGNGITDDTEAIQKALNEAKPGDTVYVYPGIYKASLLVMPEGVTLEMSTTMTDAKEGLTETLARQISRGEITVLRGVRIMNNGHNMPGAEGSSNLTIRGGVIDNEGSTRSALIFGCADGVVIENVIFKDIKNNHFIQLTGCTNTTIRNCCFAGFVVGETFTREVVQVEVSTPGATGTPPGSPLTFQEGEYNYAANIEISGCYFGESDECGAPLIAIGHHSYAGDATVTGFRIVNNVFDEVLHAAIRYCNIIDTEISGNTFISTSKYMNATQFSQAANPAFIVIYPASGDTTYKNIVTGASVTKAVSSEQSGTHNLLIKNNNFILGEGSDKRIVYINGPTAIPGLTYVTGQLRQKLFNETPYYYTGFIRSSNYLSNLTISGNNITIEGQPKYSNYFMFILNVYGLDISDNSINLSEGVSFSTTTYGINGLNAKRITNGEEAGKRYISTQGVSKPIVFEDTGGGSFSIKSQKSVNVVLTVEGSGRIETLPNPNRDGSAIVRVIPNEGYVFDGWYTPDKTRYTTPSATIQDGITLTAVFKTAP
jgi:uncharacterized repeat protein (TIGR02543 family)